MNTILNKLRISTGFATLSADECAELVAHIEGGVVVREKQAKDEELLFINASGMAEVKAALDAGLEGYALRNRLREIVDGVLDEIAAMPERQGEAGNGTAYIVDDEPGDFVRVVDGLQARHRAYHGQAEYRCPTTSRRTSHRALEVGSENFSRRG